MEHEARKAQLREAQQRLADKRRADGLFKLSVWVTQEQAERVRELLKDCPRVGLAGDQEI
jgi:negative regulator of sigma E activity